MNRPLTDADSLAVRAVDDAAAMEQLYRDHNYAVWRDLMRLTNCDEHLSNDIASQAWLYIYETLRAFDPTQCGFLTWAIRISRSRLGNHWRDSRVRMAHDTYGQDETVDLTNPADVSAENEATRELLRQVRNLLPHNQAQAILLTEFVGMTYGEASELLGAKEATVRQWKSRGLQTLRSRLTVTITDSTPDGARALTLV